MDEERAGAVRDIVRDARADSGTRTSFLAEEWDAGYSGGEGGGEDEQRERKRIVHHARTGIPPWISAG